jgi:L-2-hydroxyglutarate oxidase LhgO
MSDYNVITVGGSIVGLAAALEITRRFPMCSRCRSKKQSAWAGIRTATAAASSIAAGVYYKPGSLKARLFEESGAAVERHFFLLIEAK